MTMSVFTELSACMWQLLNIIPRSFSEKQCYFQSRCDPGAQSSVKSLGYICSNSQKYVVWVKIINFV